MEISSALRVHLQCELCSLTDTCRLCFLQHRRRCCQRQPAPGHHQQHCQHRRPAHQTIRFARKRHFGASRWGRLELRALQGAADAPLLDGSLSPPPRPWHTARPEVASQALIMHCCHGLQAGIICSVIHHCPLWKGFGVSVAGPVHAAERVGERRRPPGQPVDAGPQRRRQRQRCDAPSMWTLLLLHHLNCSRNGEQLDVRFEHYCVVIPISEELLAMYLQDRHHRHRRLPGELWPEPLKALGRRISRWCPQRNAVCPALLPAALSMHRRICIHLQCILYHCSVIGLSL